MPSDAIASTATVENASSSDVPESTETTEPPAEVAGVSKSPPAKRLK